ncbi:MAG: hypothetical protein JWO05_3146 [Gemmatimonadetes bacterium]|nr:hypothetical protein [Gemmatimonadota bacterium]
MTGTHHRQTTPVYGAALRDIIVKTDSVRCRNCDAPLHGSYCSQCGQEAKPADPTVGAIVGELWSEFVQVDGKVLNTLRALFKRPGFLTTEYLDGRRARYLSPLRLYLFASVAFFALRAVLPTTGFHLQLSRDKQLSESQFNAKLDTLAQVLGEPGERIRRGFVRGTKDDQALDSTFFAALPRGIFLLVPFFALLVGLGFRGAGRHYPAHLVFSLQLHAFFFAMFAAGLLAALTPFGVNLALQLAILVWSTIYTERAFAAVYGGSIGKNLVKTVGITVAYSFGLFALVIALIFWTVYALGA